jgi:deoxyribonuclease-4
MAREQKTKDVELLFGAHVKGGLTGAVKTALDIGARAMQIFIGSPQTWKEPVPTGADLESFVSEVEKNRLGPVFVHGNYLVNLASSVETNWQRSIDNLYTALRLADRAKAAGLIFHPGSTKDLSYDEAFGRVLQAIERVLEGYNGNCRLILEVCAGQGQTIGSTFKQFGEIISAMGGDARLAVCWDTCHLLNAGYDVATQAGLDKTISEFEDAVGFDRLLVIHANDSKNPLGARKDRHENIGKGYIGEEGFARMLTHPLLRPLPWILEVPGFEDKGPDRKNIQILERLARLQN